MQRNLREHKSRRRTALFCDRTESIGRLARVATAGRQAPIVRQTFRTRKPLDRADPRRQRQAAIRSAARDAGQHDGRLVPSLPLHDFRPGLLDLLLPQLPLHQE